MVNRISDFRPKSRWPFSTFPGLPPRTSPARESARWLPPRSPGSNSRTALIRNSRKPPALLTSSLSSATASFSDSPDSWRCSFGFCIYRIWKSNRWCSGRPGPRGSAAAEDLTVPFSSAGFLGGSTTPLDCWWVPNYLPLVVFTYIITKVMFLY